MVWKFATVVSALALPCLFVAFKSGAFADETKLVPSSKSTTLMSGSKRIALVEPVPLSVRSGQGASSWSSEPTIVQPVLLPANATSLPRFHSAVPMQTLSMVRVIDTTPVHPYRFRLDESHRGSRTQSGISFSIPAITLTVPHEGSSSWSHNPGPLKVQQFSTLSTAVTPEFAAKYPVVSFPSVPSTKSGWIITTDDLPMIFPPPEKK